MLSTLLFQGELKTAGPQGSVSISVAVTEEGGGGEDGGDKMSCTKRQEAETGECRRV